jgi:hypothetical protein
MLKKPKKFHLAQAVIKSLPLAVILFVALSIFTKEKLKSASLTSVSVTLSNSRVSFRGALTSGNTAGSSSVIINTTPGAFPSSSRGRQHGALYRS